MLKMQTETRADRMRRTMSDLTRAQKVMRKLGSGAPRSELRTPREAVQLAGLFHAKMLEEMRTTEPPLDEGDGAVQIAYLSPDLTMILTSRFYPGREESMAEALGKQCCIMAGLIYGILDRDAKDDEGNKTPRMIAGAKPFVDTYLVRDALKRRIETPDDGGLD